VGFDLRWRGKKATAPATPPTARGTSTFETLRAWRQDMAKTQGVPPYVIFHDTTLRDIAEMRPETLESLAVIPGIGASKLARYGQAVLAVLGLGPRPLP